MIRKPASVRASLDSEQRALGGHIHPPQALARSRHRAHGLTVATRAVSPAVYATFMCPLCGTQQSGRMTAMCSQPDAHATGAGSSSDAYAMPLFRQPSIVDALMNALPYSRRRWCGMPRCECSGCANSVVSRDEWMAWFVRQQNAVCERCHEAARVVGRDGQTYLVCETCDVFWA